MRLSAGAWEGVPAECDDLRIVAYGIVPSKLIALEEGAD